MATLPAIDIGATAIHVVNGRLSRIEIKVDDLIESSHKSFSRIESLLAVALLRARHHDENAKESDTRIVGLEARVNRWAGAVSLLVVASGVIVGLAGAYR